MEPFQFKDREDQIWDLELDYNTICEVRKDTGVDLHKADTGEPFEQMEESIKTTVDVISVILSPQIHKRELSAEDFAKRLKGDVIERAVDALSQAILAYFPPKKRPVLKAILEKTAEIQNQGAEMIMERVKSPEMTNYLKATMDTALAKKMKDAEKEFEKKLEQL